MFKIPFKMGSFFMMTLALPPHHMVLLHHSIESGRRVVVIKTYLTSQEGSKVPRGTEAPRDAVVLTQQNVHRRALASLQRCWWASIREMGSVSTFAYHCTSDGSTVIISCVSAVETENSGFKHTFSHHLQGHKVAERHPVS